MSTKTAHGFVEPCPPSVGAPTGYTSPVPEYTVGPMEYVISTKGAKGGGDRLSQSLQEQTKALIREFEDRINGYAEELIEASNQMLVERIARMVFCEEEFFSISFVTGAMEIVNPFVGGDWRASESYARDASCRKLKGKFSDLTEKEHEKIADEICAHVSSEFGHRTYKTALTYGSTQNPEFVEYIIFVCNKTLSEKKEREKKWDANGMRVKKRSSRSSRRSSTDYACTIT